MSPAPTRASAQRSHFLSDLTWSQQLLHPGRALLQTPLGTAIPTTAGRPAVGVLATLLDVAGSDPAMAAFPGDWMTTRDLAVHAGDHVPSGPVVVDAHLERGGRSGVVVTGAVYDGGGEDDLEALATSIDAGRLQRIATGVITFARISRDAAPDMDDYNPAEWVGQLRRSNDVPPVTASVYDGLSLRRTEAPGVLELEPTSYVLNAIGTITGGAQAAFAEIAARSIRPDLVVTDLQVHFLATVKVGPMRSAVSVLLDREDRSVVDVRLLDGGQSDQLIGLATVSLAAPR